MDGRHNDKMDLMKCVAIFSVVFLRLALPGLLGQTVNCLSRFAVPLFFLSAGYFSWGKGTSALARNCRRTGVRILLACLPALLWAVFWLFGRGRTWPPTCWGGWSPSTVSGSGTPAGWIPLLRPRGLDGGAPGAAAPSAT